MGDLFFPVGPELFHPAVELLAELAVQVSRGLVPGRRRRDGRAQVSKRYLFELRHRRLSSVEPDRLLDRRSELLCESEDRLTGDLGPAFGASTLAFFRDRSADAWDATRGKTLGYGSLFRGQAREQEVAVGRSGLEARGAPACWGLGSP